MSTDDSDRADLIQYRLAEAKDTQSDVELLISYDRFRAAINRIYCSMFYSLLALAAKYEFDTSKHAQLIGRFNKTFIQPKLIEAKYGKIINKAFSRRTKGDYDSYVEFDSEMIKEMYEEMKDFNCEIEKFIRRK
ncbi:MAG: HEPN domain-containing protein [Cytophagales bacterium]